MSSQREEREQAPPPLLGGVIPKSVSGSPRLLLLTTHTQEPPPPTPFLATRALMRIPVTGSCDQNALWTIWHLCCHPCEVTKTCSQDWASLRLWSAGHNSRGLQLPPSPVYVSGNLLVGLVLIWLWKRVSEKHTHRRTETESALFSCSKYSSTVAPFWTWLPWVGRPGPSCLLQPVLPDKARGGSGRNRYSGQLVMGIYRPDK